MAQVGNWIRAVANGGRYQEHLFGNDGSDTSARTYLDVLFDNLFARTGLIYNVRRFSLDGSKSAIPDAVNDRTAISRSDVRISCISSPIVVEGLANPGDRLDLKRQDFRDQCQLLRTPGSLADDRWIEERLRELELALEFKPHIISFSEMAYPPPRVPEHGGWSTEDIDSAVARRRDFEKIVVGMMEKIKPQPFVFLGSYHCLMSLYNVGVVLPWGAYVDNIPILLESEDLDSGTVNKRERTSAKPPILYRKRFPARRVGEATRVPHSQTLDIFEMPFGQIGLLICSDIVDLNQFMAVAHRNRVENRKSKIDYLVVPAFNRSSKLMSMCEELSFIAANTVIMVNANHDDARFPNTEIYCCGRRSSVLPQTLIRGAATEYVDHGGGRHGVILNSTVRNGRMMNFREEHVRHIQTVGAPSSFSKTVGV